MEQEGNSFKPYKGKSKSYKQDSSTISIPSFKPYKGKSKSQQKKQRLLWWVLVSNPIRESQNSTVRVKTVFRDDSFKPYKGKSKLGDFKI